MKRTGIIIICLLLMAAVTGTAEEAGNIPSIRETMQTEQTVTPFSFRNGIGWNMSMDQIKTLEPVPMAERSSNDWSVMVTSEQVQVSRFQADLVFMFWQDKLKMITYEFQADASKLNYQYLLGALCSVYGDSHEAQPAAIKSMMDRIYPDRYRADWIREAHAWTAADGTNLFLYYFSANEYAILYVSPELTVQGGGGYEINGL